MTQPHHIVIVGGGAAGLPLATRLGDGLGRKKQVTVTLVDHNASHLWKPLLHEVAAGRVDADLHDVDYFLLAYWHNFRFRQGDVIGLDRKQHELRLGVVRDEDGAEILPERVVRYDTLIFCVGSVNNDFGIPGVSDRAIALDAPADAERFHRRLLAACVSADERRAHDEPATVDVVIIGAGATGVELAAEVRHCTRAHASYGLEFLKPERDVRLTLIEAAPRILPPLSENIAKAATDLLRELDVAVRTGERVTSIDADGVHTESKGAARKCSRPISLHGRPASRRPPGSTISMGSRSIAAISSWSTPRLRRHAIPTSSRSATAPPVRGPRRDPRRFCRRARRSRASRRRSS